MCVCCCRDDLIFLIYLYQRWIYRVDMTRVNEFGFSGQQKEEAEAAAAGGQGAEPAALTEVSVGSSRRFVLGVLGEWWVLCGLSHFNTVVRSVPELCARLLSLCAGCCRRRGRGGGCRQHTPPQGSSSSRAFQWQSSTGGGASSCS